MLGDVVTLGLAVLSHASMADTFTWRASFVANAYVDATTNSAAGFVGFTHCQSFPLVD
jgi:hypothetical protein